MISKTFQICDAYEAGFGKGQDMAKCENPYDPLADSWEAWNIGYRRGSQRRVDKTNEDPCPGCSAPGVCRTPACGRLKLPLDHPLRNSKKHEPTIDLGKYAGTYGG